MATAWREDAREFDRVHHVATCANAIVKRSNRGSSSVVVFPPQFSLKGRAILCWQLPRGDRNLAKAPRAVYTGMTHPSSLRPTASPQAARRAGHAETFAPHGRHLWSSGLPAQVPVS
jgi:hypothetical protein